MEFSPETKAKCAQHGIDIEASYNAFLLDIKHGGGAYRELRQTLIYGFQPGTKTGESRGVYAKRRREAAADRPQWNETRRRQHRCRCDTCYAAHQAGRAA